jgi:chromosome segregation ATPase
MSPEEQEQWKQLDARLAEDEKKLLATANLVRAGIPMLVSQQMRIDALIDSDTRLYGRIQELTEDIREYREAQKDTDRRLAHLADSVQKLVDSWKTGNGSR